MSFTDVLERDTRAEKVALAMGVHKFPLCFQRVKDLSCSNIPERNLSDYGSNNYPAVYYR